jgi:dihydroorotase-like cyclic amidohydrolase
MNIKPSSIEVGNQAEINVLDPQCEWKFKDSDIHSKSCNSPIVGMHLMGKINLTINKGYILNKK